MGSYNRDKHRQIMIHADTKLELSKLFPTLEVKTYNDAIEELIGQYHRSG